MFGNLFDEDAEKGAQVDSVIREYAVENYSNPENKLSTNYYSDNQKGGFVAYVSKGIMVKPDLLEKFEKQVEEWKRKGLSFALALDRGMPISTVETFSHALELHTASSDSTFFLNVNDPKGGSRIMQSGKIPLLSAYSDHLGVLVTAALCAHESNVPLIIMTDAAEFGKLATPLKKVPKKKSAPLLVEEALSITKSQLEQGEVPVLDAAGLGVIAQHGTRTHVLEDKNMDHAEKIANGEASSGIEIR